MSKSLKLTVNPVRVLFAGENNYIIGEAKCVPKARKVVVKGKLAEFHVWDTLELECDIEQHPKFGVTHAVKRVLSVRKSDVDRTNASNIILSLQRNMSTSDADMMTMGIFKRHAAPIPFSKFVEIVESAVPRLGATVTSETVSPSDLVSQFWALHLVINPRKVWNVLKNDLLIFCTRNAFRLPPLNYETARETWVDITKQDLPPRAWQTIEKYREIERACARDNALSADVQLDEEYHGVCRLPNGRAMLRCNYELLQRLGQQISSLMSRKPADLPYRSIKKSPFTLNGKQSGALAAAEHFRIACIIGPAGSGKSYVTSSILYRFNGKHCLVLSRAARVGTEYVESLQNVENAPTKLRAETIDHVVHAACHNTKLSRQDAENIRVIIVEEATMMTCQDASDLLTAFPNISLLLLSGDHLQIGPVTNEPSFFNAFTRRYANKPFVITLDVVKRTNDEKLLAAVTAIRERNYEALLQALGDSVKITPRPTLISETARTIDSSDTLILAQRHEEVDAFNREMFYNLFPLETEYNALSYRVGETIRITENFKGKVYENKPHLDTSVFNNGAKYTIATITDYAVEGGAISSVLATGDKTKLPGSYYRVVKLTDGKQINLIDYKSFKRGYAMTIASSQGCETDRVLFYIQPNFTRIDFQQFYVAASRAIKSLEIVGELDDIKRILETDRIEYTADIEDILPAFNAETMMHRAKKMKKDKKRAAANAGTNKRRKTAK